jgi:hypothetical protein
MSLATDISLIVVLILSLLYCVYTGYDRRKTVYLLYKKGIVSAAQAVSSEPSLTSLEPTVEGWSWWTGPLLVLDGTLKNLPSDANVLYA